MRKHLLANEIGAWLDLDHEFRVCTVCDTFENEEHFMLNCVQFDHLRERYLHKFLRLKDGGTDTERLIYLINNPEKKVLDKVCIYLKKAFKLHAEYAYMHISRPYQHG